MLTVVNIKSSADTELGYTLCKVNLMSITDVICGLDLTVVSCQDGVNSNTVGSVLISQLALCLKPRYHFSACEGVSYERQPYRYIYLCLLYN